MNWFICLAFFWLFTLPSFAQKPFAFFKAPTIGSSFSPSNISGLKLWLASDSITGLSDGDPVSSWQDNSGLGNHAVQATAGLRPTWHNSTHLLNGKPGVFYTSSTDRELIAPVSVSGTDLTCIIVANANPAATFPYRLLSLSNGDANYDYDSASRGVPFYLSSASMLSGYRNSTQLDGKTVSLGTPFIATSQFSGTSHTMKLNGALGGNSTTSGSFGFSNVEVGGFGGTQAIAQCWYGEIYEVLVYDSALSLSNMEAVEDYLGVKYGITTRLVNEGFEGAGTPAFWYNGGADPDYTATALAGSQSLHIDGVEYLVITSGGLLNHSEVYGKFKFRPVTLPTPSGLSFSLLDVDFNYLHQLVIWADGTIGCGGNVTTAAMTAGQDYWIYFRYKAGTGSNAIQSAGFSATEVRPTSGANFCGITNGTQTTNVTQFQPISSNGGVYILDSVQIDTTTFD